uniref:Uncharacterized protein n=1 Tax=Rhodnius prolixus TaxID=13249 RepID=T1HWP9_RHOPR
MVDESPLNHIDQVGFNNAPGDYYYEEPYRNRGKSFPVALNKQLTHSTHSKDGEFRENNYVQHSHRKIDKLSAEPNVKEVLVDSDYDGHNASPNGAILSLSLGLCLTTFMVLIVGCRLRMVRRRMRRGGKLSYAHDADYLVNGMYL